MPITFRHDAAGIPVGKDKSSQKYGYELVGQQRKYDAEARARSEAAQFESQQQANTQAFQWQRDRANAVNQAAMFNADLQSRERQAEEARKFQRDEAEARRKQEMMDRAQRQEHGFILQSIENGEYDQATARALEQNILAESRAMTATGIDATQRAAALQQVMDERAKLTALRREPPPKPAPQPVMYTDDQGRQWIQSGKDKWEQIKPQAEPQQGPIDSSVGFQDPKNRDRYLGLAEKDLMDPEDPTKKPSRDQVWARARQLWNTDEYERTRDDGPMGPPSPASPSGVQGGQPTSPPGGMAIPPAQSQQPPVSAPAGGVVLPPYLPQEPSAAAPAPSPSPSGGVSQPPSGYLPGYEPKPKPGVATGGQGHPVGGQGIYKPNWGDIDPGIIANPRVLGVNMDPGIIANPPGSGRNMDPGIIANPPSTQLPRDTRYTPANNTGGGYGTTDDFVKGRDDRKPAEISHEPVVVEGGKGAVGAQTPTYSLESMNKFWDNKIGSTRNKQDRLEFENIKSFVSQEQPQAIKDAIMTAYDPSTSPDEKRKAIQFLKSNKISLLEIARKPRDNKDAADGGFGTMLSIN